ncbi:MAG: hypothetical protein H5T37_00835 [Methanobacteriaceae archaeon]|nr:MAG: hypothetical protein XD44_1352 [Methanobacteriaceae archaeon 41_258]MBC7088921.1 hypothetical protein [Methanobacteriaceae archaeon]
MIRVNVDSEAMVTIPTLDGVICEGALPYTSSIKKSRYGIIKSVIVKSGIKSKILESDIVVLSCGNGIPPDIKRLWVCQLRTTYGLTSSSSLGLLRWAEQLNELPMLWYT